LIQNKTDRVWETDPLEESLKKANERLVAIPITIAYNDPNLNLNNRFSTFDNKTGRVLCAGNGDKARRSTDQGVLNIDCPRPEACQYGQAQRCKSMNRAYFRIEGSADELGVHVLHTTSWNSLSALGTRLSQLHGLTQGVMAGMPMMLVMKGKTTTASFRDIFYFADLVTRPGQTLLQAVKQAKVFQNDLNEAGLSISGMEDALRAGLANGDFADEIDDVDEWLSDEELINAADRGFPSALVGSGLETLAKNLQSLVQASKTEPDGTVTGSQSNVPSLVIASAEHVADKVSKMKTQPKANAVPVSRPAVKTPNPHTAQKADHMF